jgi:hypothetical protein
MSNDAYKAFDLQKESSTNVAVNKNEIPDEDFANDPKMILLYENDPAIKKKALKKIEKEIYSSVMGKIKETQKKENKPF